MDTKMTPRQTAARGWEEELLVTPCRQAPPSLRPTAAVLPPRRRDKGRKSQKLSNDETMQTSCSFSCSRCIVLTCLSSAVQLCLFLHPALLPFDPHVLPFSPLVKPPVSALSPESFHLNPSSLLQLLLIFSLPKTKTLTLDAGPRRLCERCAMTVFDH